MPAPVPPPPSYFLTNPGVSPHPTVQAITTPTSSHSRGNWGLKRDLPTKTKYPFLRYTALDTLEHFTTYESAADDVLTLKKWQEMDLPLLKGPAIDHSLESHSFARRESVFDGGDTEEYKWRFEGPYLPDLPAGEFKRYIETKIKPRRAEFVAYVTEHQEKWGSKSSFSDRPDQGAPGKWGSAQGGETWTDEKKKKKGGLDEAPLEDIDEAPLEDIDVRALRADPDLLEKLAMQFLDLPFYSRPHRTHPSGGLHYTRSAAHIRNDPIEGPQAGAKLVPGRNMNYQSSTGALVGLGGIVAKATDAGRLEDSVRTYNNRYQVKKYVPGRAKLDALGRVLLDVDIINNESSQGAYGGSRSIGYASMGLARTGETATDILKTLGGGGGRYSGVYDSVREPKNTGDGKPVVEGRPVVGGRSAEKQKYVDDVMDLLDNYKR